MMKNVFYIKIRRIKNAIYSVIKRNKHKPEKTKFQWQS
mgnify:CR=1 FL=1